MSKILEEEIYGKVATPKRKILGEFIENCSSCIAFDPISVII